MDQVHYTSEKMDWGTPDSIYDPLYAEFEFDLDVACTSENQKCWRGLALDKGFNGLTESWNPESACWMNPPYGKELPKWVQKAWGEKKRGVTVVCLVPARTDTRWWSIFWDHEKHGMRHEGDECRFVKGRIKFEGAPASAPFPSAIIVLRGRIAEKWCAKCSRIVRLGIPNCTQGRACGLKQDTFNEK